MRKIGVLVKLQLYVKVVIKSEDLNVLKSGHT